MSAFDPKRTSAPFLSTRKSCYDLAVRASGQQMRRREFIILVGGAALTWPFRARPPQGVKFPQIACLGPDPPTPDPRLYQTFASQLEKNRFREGQNISVDYRAIQDPRGPFVGAAELVRAQPDLLVIVGPEVALQA